jgi:ribosome-binding protein aMBF1 (putative translation factor)
MDKREKNASAPDLQETIRRVRFFAAAEIIRRRKRAKLSRADLARKIQASEDFVRAVEMGEQDPKLTELERIADALNCRVQDLIPPLTRKARAFAIKVDAVGEPVRRAISGLLQALLKTTKGSGGPHI